MWRIHVDILGPLCQTLNGNQYVAIGVCAFTKYVEAEGKIQSIIFRVAIYACDLNLLKHPPPQKKKTGVWGGGGRFEFFTFFLK